jgi:predicted phosphodiesterase
MPRYSLARLEAEKVCSRFPDAPNMQLAKKLRKEAPLLFASVEVARSMVRQIRGSNNSIGHGHASQPRPKGVAGQLPPIPPNAHVSYKDFPIDTKRVGIICDTHFPHCEWRVVKAARNEFKRRNIDTLILNGDICDFYGLSIYETDPRKRDLAREIKIASEAMAWFRQSFPKARIIYKWGNHDERWSKYLWRQAPVLLDLPNATLSQVLLLKHYGIEEVTDKQLMELNGHFLVAHGHEIHKGGGKHIADQVARKLQRAGCVGHSHRTDRARLAPHMRRHQFVYAVGCSCHLNEEYARVNHNNYGFAAAEVWKDDIDFSNYELRRDDFKVIQ